MKCGLIIINGKQLPLKSVQLGAAKKILACSSKTCSEAVRGDICTHTHTHTHTHKDPQDLVTLLLSSRPRSTPPHPSPSCRHNHHSPPSQSSGASRELEHRYVDMQTMEEY